ncbi:pectin lyase fold/virulence factor [Hyaloscypha finlandica]|nr:pectin lyase fold/virulence factor [Hyaloscypha finlandica]
MKLPTAAVTAIILGLASAKTTTITTTCGKTIQQTIDDAHPGDRIVVEKGTYAEQLTISKNGISLIGHEATLSVPGTPVHNTCSGLAGPDVTNQVDPTVDTQAGICITGTDVSLARWEFEHRTFNSVGSTVKEVSVKGFTVNGFGLGVAVVGARDTTVSGNTLIDNNFYGALTVGSKNTVFKHNTVYSTPLPFPFIRVIGICMDDRNSVSVHHNGISNYWVGLCLQTNEPNVYENRVHDTCIGAFVDPNVDGAKVHDNDISGTGTNCRAPDGSDNPIFGGQVYGIVMSGAINTVVKGNKIHDKLGLGYGIVIMDDASGAVASGNLVEKNNVTGNEIDIHVETIGKKNVVKKNNLCASSFPSGLCK